MVWVGIFLVVNGILDLNVTYKSRAVSDFVIAIAGIALGVLVLTGTIH